MLLLLFSAEVPSTAVKEVGLVVSPLRYRLEDVEVEIVRS